MSKDNVEIALDTVDAAFQSGDFEAAALHFHPDAEWHNTGGFPGPQSCSGREEITTFWRSFLEVFEFESQTEEVARGGDTVVVQIHSRGSATGSGIPVDVTWAITFRFERGAIVWAEARGDYAKAIAAAGLSTDDAG